MIKLSYKTKSVIFFAGLILVTGILVFLICISAAVPLLLCILLLLVLLILWGFKHLYEPAAAILGLMQKALRQNEWDWLKDHPVWKHTEYGIITQAVLNSLIAEATKKEAAVSDERQANLLALQSQINPHFLYNTLDCIRGQAMMDNNREIAEMLAALSDFFRYSISHRDALVTLQDELDSVVNYMVIQRYRFNDRYRFESEIQDDQSLILGCYVPKLILQPVIENAIIHGLENRSKGVIRIHIAFSDDLLNITVSDDGEGMDDLQLAEIMNRIHADSSSSLSYSGTGIALPNIHRRIRMMFGKMYGIQMYSTKEKGTDVEFVLPRMTNKIGIRT
ncbi:hypothetical protein FACS1894130_02300 [Spirochaetia bacterium]|nr:hypothetical protein FACS1894130_02300 [Spirochaetia bacterium]